MMMGWYNQGWNGWMIAMMMVWLIVIAIAVWALIALTPGGNAETHSAAYSKGPSHATSESARAILDRRLAAGQIDEAEYGRIRALLDNPLMSGPTAGDG